jgi:hypothetical protein
MRTTLSTAVVTIAALAVAAPAGAWGAAAHRYIMRRAIDLLPPSIKPLFDEHRDEAIMRIVDPDLWRTVGWDEDHNHFLDLGVPEYGAYPFTALPREYGAAVEKFGLATLRKYGTLPWREAEEFGNLRRAFEGSGRGAPFARGDIVLFAAVASHYLQDAHQPLHATGNYDGQLTGQHGVHARFESELFERYESRLTITPPSMPPITNPRDRAFEILLASYKLVDPLLAADKAAAAGKSEYDDDYFEKFLARVKPMLEQRVGESIAATAALIVGAWEQAGRPAIGPPGRRPVQPIRKRGDGPR